jgi:hypothetical protein
MKLKTIALAVAAACAAAPALALNIADSTAAITAGRVIYVSGASASTANVYQGFRSMCQAGTIDLYTAGTNVGAANPVTGPGQTNGTAKWDNWGAYTCKLQAGLTETDGVTPISLSNQNVVMMHTVDGGSFNSVMGMSTSSAQQVAFLTTNFAGCARGVGGTAVNDMGDPVYNACTKSANRQSHGGFSDVEAGIFKNVFAANPTPNFALSEVEVTPANYAQVFGVAVSNALYAAMQTAQGINAATCVGTACQPSITRQQYASIVTNNAASKGHVDFSFLTGASGASQVVNLCRRVDTSGTQASSNVFFLDNPCAGDPDIGGLGSPATLANFDNTATFTINEGSTTGNAKTCLNGAGWNIGILSLENAPGASDTWKFVKLNSVSPNEEANQNVSGIEGRYQFVMESVLHSHPTITPAQSKQVLLGIAKRLGDAPTMPILRGLFIVPQPAMGTAYTYEGTPAKVGKGTRGYNSCSPMTESH